MTQVTLLNEKRPAIRRLNKNSKILKTIIGAVQEKKGENIISLDLRKIPEAVADFFVICEAGSSTQVKAIADYVDEKVRKNTGEQPYKTEGLSGLNWVLVDYINVVVHIFQPESRQFYKLEEMWSDAACEVLAE
ncbi:MAG TPA: ribosome silencing factor [Chitinophagaceae bacterium]|nr:ribosome silencing factor [Chitinophagaceae bacterium]